MEQTNNIQEICLHYTRKKIENRKITSSTNAYMLAKEIYLKSESVMDLKEYFFVIYLNRANNILGFLKLSEGGISGTVACVKLILATALKTASSALILVHNHPSGALKPSNSDIKLTKRIKEGAEILDIQVLDHLILSSEGYYSFADEGELIR